MGHRLRCFLNSHVGLTYKKQGDRCPSPLTFLLVLPTPQAGDDMKDFMLVQTLAHLLRGNHG